MRLCADDAVKVTYEKLSEQLSVAGSGFADIFKLLDKGKGKLLRTRLGIVCAVDEKGTVDESITDKLCALELLHLATLVHDDIIDEAEYRRGLPSVQSAFGKHGAVIAGDYLFTRSFKMLSDGDSDTLRIFSRAVSAVCRGEMLQEQSLFDRTLTPVRYLRTISGKTAALFAAAAVTGQTGSIYLNIGHKFGVVYQVLDDIRDFTGCDNAFGKKPCFSDLKSGVITLPAVYCLQKEPKMTDEDIIGQIGYGIEKAREFAARYRAKACALADRAGLAGKNELNNMFDKIMQ